MKKKLIKFKNSPFQKFLSKHKKYAPIYFFIGGFIFDTLTLGRIDRLYDVTVLCVHMSCLSVTLYLFNLMDDDKWNNTFLEKYQEYFPLVIQFFFGGLSSAYVIYFSRSVSLSRTASFFVILVGLLLANELLKKRISNKYLQFSIYFFISFTFFSFMIPVFFNVMNTLIFIISGIVSLSCTLLLIRIIYKSSPSTRAEINIKKLVGLIVSIYLVINVFYYFNLIPPVPLALQVGVVAHEVKKANNDYVVTYETDNRLLFWRDYSQKFHYSPNQKIFVFSSVFAPTSLQKSIEHKWKWYNNTLGEWQVIDRISYQITGGRTEGFRGYTYKSNIKEGLWEVEVLTKEELLIGVISFEVIIAPGKASGNLIEKVY